VATNNTKRKKTTSKPKENKEVVEVMNGNGEVVETVEVEQPDIKEPVFIKEKKILLDLSSKVVHLIPPNVVRVEIVNLGAGEVYFNTEENIELYVPDKTIIAGESKVFEKVSKLYFFSNCRPTIIIRYFE